MTKQEFDTFEQATYELLSTFKDKIKTIVGDGYTNLDDLKDDIQLMLDDEGVELNEAYDDNVFNFISDDELADWLWREGICRVFERHEYYVRPIRPIDISKGENNADS